MNFDLENYFGKKVVGIDEVGRGPLAGPVVAAAVYIDRSLWKRYLKKYPTISKINDSKKISKKNREKIYDILTKIISYGIGASSVKEIEEKNILEASLIAMERAYKSLNINAEMVIVDGINIPKINTNVKAFFEKLGGGKESREILKMLDNAWNGAASELPAKAKNAVAALQKFDISREKASESSSKRKFALIAKEFKKDKLEFYSTDFYYPFRNNFIDMLGNWLKKSSNMVYFLRTVGYYTFDDADATPCPYKLLIGSEKSSSLKDVSSDEDMKEFLFNEKASNLSGITFNYSGTAQSFNMTLKYKVNGNYSVDIPITARTRAAGGWSGKALYITSPGIKLVQ